MKKLKFISLAFLLGITAMLIGACGTPMEKIVLGTYNATNQTFTANDENALYSLKVNGYNLTLKGTIPYSESILDITAGNIVAIKFIKPEGVGPADSGTTIKTTNRQDASAGGWNNYNKDALETDGSLIWVTKVSKDNSVQIKIKWNSNTTEALYTLSVDSTATMQTSTT